MDNTDNDNKPLVCTSKVYGTIDYMKPLVCHEPDYRSVTKIALQYTPPISQNYESVKQTISKDLLTRNARASEDTHISVYNDSYQPKRWDTNTERYSRAFAAQDVLYLRDSKEKFFRDPPKPRRFPVSTMKDSFPRHPLPEVKKIKEEKSANPDSFCQIKALGRDEQLAIPPEERGYIKLMDPYLSTSRQVHVPFTVNQWNGVAKKDVLTFYDYVEPKIPKCLGFGVKNVPHLGPLFPVPVEPIYDKLQFSRAGKITRFPKSAKTIPHKGRISETKSQYIAPVLSSDFYPDIHKSGVEYGEYLPSPSPWQVLSIPGMYDTEHCHYGTGWPVNTIVKQDTRKKITHKPCYVKVK